MEAETRMILRSFGTVIALIGLVCGAGSVWCGLNTGFFDQTGTKAPAGCLIISTVAFAIGFGMLAVSFHRPRCAMCGYVKYGRYCSKCGVAGEGA